MPELLTGPRLVDGLNFTKGTYGYPPGPFLSAGGAVYMSWDGKTPIGWSIWKAPNRNAPFVRVADSGVIANLPVMTQTIPSFGVRGTAYGGPAGHIYFLVEPFAFPATWEMRIYDWNMTTDTGAWLSVATSRGVNGGICSYNFDPASGKHYCFYKRNAGGFSHIYLKVYNGAAWGPEIDLIPDTVLNHVIFARYSEISAGGVAYIWYGDQAPPFGTPTDENLRWWDPVGGVSAATLIQQIPGSRNPLGAPMFFYGGLLYMAMKRYTPGAFGYPVPRVFTFDPANPAAPMGVYDPPSNRIWQGIGAGIADGKYWVCWNEDTLLDGSATIDRMVFTHFDGVSWSVPQVWHDEQLFPSFLVFIGGVWVPYPNQFGHEIGQWIADFSGGVIGLHEALEYPYDPVGHPYNAYCTGFFWFGGAPPPTPAGPIAVGGTRRMVVLVPNYWDHCLRAAPPDWKDLPPPTQCCVPDEQSYFNWVTPPQGYRAFRQVGAVATPLAAAGDVTVLQFMVPFGYDGVIRGMFHKYTGPGFVEGSGDIIWRLRTNNIYAKHLGAMLVTVGDVDKPHPVSDGIPLTSRQWIRYIVNVPNLSGGILPVNSRIVCGVEGWFYPRR